MSERLDDILQDTAPGPRNQSIIDFSGNVGEMLGVFDEITFGWFIIEKVHVYDGFIGITASYRWTVERWAELSVDSMLMNSGWEHSPHLYADWREIEEDELQVRYKTEILGADVYANFLVEMTERAFEVLSYDEPPEKKELNEEKLLEMFKDVDR